MAGILVVLVLILQFLLRNKLEARWKYLLWLPVAIRLLLPWAPESSLSLYNVLSLEAITPRIHEQSQSSTIKKEAERISVAPVLAERSLTLETTGIEKESALNHEAETVQESRSWWSGFKQIGFSNVFMLVWLAGVLFLTVKTVYDQLRLKQSLREGRTIETPLLSSLFHEEKQRLGVKRKVRFVASESIPGPSVVGFNKPVIVISPSLLGALQKDQLQYILAHEFAHIKRWDVVVNWIMHMILILHWFNPLIWLAVHKVREDQEMACDACALDRLSPQQSSAYGQTIIHVLEYFSSSHHQPGLVGLSATHKQMKKRLLMIKHFHNKSYHLSIFGMMVILALGSVTLVNAKGSNAGQGVQTALNQLDQGSSRAIQVSSEYLAAEKQELAYEEVRAKAIKERDELIKAVPAEDKKFIEDEINRVRELAQNSGDTYIMYHKYAKLNKGGHDLSYWGIANHYSTYEDYFKKASTLNGSILQQPANLPEGYQFSKATIKGPLEGEFYVDLRAEGKDSGKLVYTKKFDWNEAGLILLDYTNGKDTLTLSQYKMSDYERTLMARIEGFEYESSRYGKRVFGSDGKQYKYSLYTKSDLTKEQLLGILKAALKK
jgi:bla regulator protein BlaR1